MLSARDLRRVSCASFFVLAPTAFAGVHVVDASGAPGTFTAIQPAVEYAKDGDVILVKSGTYAAFALINEGVTVAAYPGATVHITAGIRVRNLAPEKTAVLIGLDVQGSQTSSPNSRIGFVGTSNLGRVRVESCTFTGASETSTNGWPGVRLDACADVALSHCISRGGLSGWVFKNFVYGGSGLEAVNSSVTLHDTQLLGGDGRDANNAFFNEGATGGDGYRGYGSTVFASMSAFQGGAGGDAWPICQTGSIGYGGSGGFGNVAQTPVDLIRLVSVTEAGGLGGLSWNESCGSTVSPSGDARYGPPSSFVDLPAVGRSMRVVDDPVREGTATTLMLSGVAGDSVELLLAYSTTSLFQPALSGQQLFPEPASVRTQRLGTIGAGGSSNVTWIAPLLDPSAASRTYFLQPVFTAAGGAGVLGTPVPLVVLDASL